MKFIDAITPNKRVIPDLLVFIIGVVTMILCFLYLKGSKQEFKDLSGIIRVVVALSSAAISIALPGFVSLETIKGDDETAEGTPPTPERTDTLWPKIKAGGALAVFILIYLFNPIN